LILNAHDIVFAQVIAALRLDDVHGLVAHVGNAMHGPDRNVRRFVDANSDFPNAFYGLRYFFADACAAKRLFGPDAAFRLTNSARRGLSPRIAHRFAVNSSTVKPMSRAICLSRIGEMSRPA